MFQNTSPLALAVSAALMAFVSNLQAVEIGAIDFTGSGFATIGFGRMLNAQDGEASDFKKPFFVSDYAQGGVYESSNNLQWKPDSKLGLQGVAKFIGTNFSITGQAVARGARNGEANLEWLFGSYKLNDSWTVQAGRKRIPMFYYSDTQDVGLALPWTHLPSQLYGWEAVNYNGVNLSYQGQWGTWSSAVNLLAGNEGRNETGYWKVYRGKNNRTDIKWDQIIGGDITLSKDWFETRAVYLQSNTRAMNVSGSWDSDPTSATYGSYISPATEFTDPGFQKIYGLAFNVDYNNWLARSEFININHNIEAGYTDQAQILGVGYRLGKWTPMVTVANYRAVATGTADPDAQEAHRTSSFTLRYDLTTSSAVKLQYDFQKDLSGPNYNLPASTTSATTNRFGDARLLTVTYDVVF